MIIRPGNERGYADHGWLRSYHTFSFAGYHDPEHMGFRALRVINEDRVEGGRGFGAHPHRDMEIISYVLEGELVHRDDMGNGSVLRPGEVQRMSAGTGVVHSEFNNSKDDLLHFLQIWILPEQRGIAPGYEQKPFPAAERQGRWRLVASRDGRDESITVHQDVNVYARLFDPDQVGDYRAPDDRHAWLHVARGRIDIAAETEEHVLRAGDAAALQPGEAIAVRASEPAEVLLFDLA